MASTSPTTEQVTLAIEAFLMGMRREFIARHGPEAECRVPVWRALSSADKAVLVRAMRAALTAANDPDLVAELRRRRQQREDAN